MLRRICFAERVEPFSARYLFFHYPDFIEKVQKLVPGATKDEELLCMLIAVGQSVDEIEQLFCLPAEQVYMFRKSVCWKMRLEEEKLLGDKIAGDIGRITPAVPQKYLS